MNRLYLLLLTLLFTATTAFAQGTVKGRVLDKRTNQPLSFVTVRLTQTSDTTFLRGATTDADGSFQITGLPDGSYKLSVSFMGYKDAERTFNVSAQHRNHHYPAIYISEDSHNLREVTVTGQRSAMKLEVDRKSFDVQSMTTTAGQSASEVLENIPSVEVDHEGNVSLRGNSSVEVWINGKASGLTADNRAQILQQLPAESIERIEVIDNPSAKFSAEGSAGIINIVLKKERKPGYYGSLQAGVDTRGGANTSFNINYNSSLLDAYLNIGYRHIEGEGKSESEQYFKQTGQRQEYSTINSNFGNHLFSRAGVTLHATKHDDFSLSGMFMGGHHHQNSNTPYYYFDNNISSMTRIRDTRSMGDMRMMYGEFNYRHSFTDRHFIDFVVDFNKWKADNDNFYTDNTYGRDSETGDNYMQYEYQYRPMFMNNRTWEVKLDYENPISENFQIQAGYQGRFSHENTPQESYIYSRYWNQQELNEAEGEQSLMQDFLLSFDKSMAVEDQLYFNRFIYDMDVHALYATATLKFGKFGVMGGLRGEYWKVKTESYTWAQEHDASLRNPAYKKDFFELFPSLFLSYQLTKNDQLQLNYTRRLRRPWGGQLNSFRDTRDATTVSFGNPELTPEFSNSFSLNYLKTWTQHSAMLSAYYRPTTDVMQRISWRSSTDGLFYTTSMNLAKSLSTGVELTVKNQLFRFLSLTTTANAYYYKLDGFTYEIDGQTIRGDEDHNFTWNARMMASIILPYDITVQLTGNYRSKQVITQGYRKPAYGLDFGLRKGFFNKALMLSINCRDVLDSRRWETVTESDTFTRHQLNRRRSRTVNFTLTYNFGNMKPKRRPQMEQGEGMDPSTNYNGGGMEE